MLGCNYDENYVERTSDTKAKQGGCGEGWQKSKYSIQKTKEDQQLTGKVIFIAVTTYFFSLDGRCPRLESTFVGAAESSRAMERAASDGPGSPSPDTCDRSLAGIDFSVVVRLSIC